MKETDPATGMAPLTDGSYWKVFKDGIKYKGQNIYRLGLVQGTKREVKRMKWYGKVYTKTVIKHKQVFEVPIWNRDNGGRYETGYAAIITPTHLRNASFRALEEYDEEVTRQRRLNELASEDNSKELLGDYPPKSLNPEGNK